jgi:hypothetical protein
MTAMTFPFPSGRGTRRMGVLQFISECIEGLHDGLALAARYDSLARKSDAELARLGLRREDIPRAALAGRRD